MKSSIIYKIQFILLLCFFYAQRGLKFCATVLHKVQRLTALSLSVFENKKSTIKVDFSFQFVELFMRYLVIYFVSLEHSDILGNNNRRTTSCNTKIRKMLCLKVVRLGPIDCIACHKKPETI